MTVSGLSIGLLGPALGGGPPAGHLGLLGLGLYPASNGALDEPLQFGIRRPAAGSAHAAIHRVGRVLVHPTLRMALGDGSTTGHQRGHVRGSAAVDFGCGAVTLAASLMGRARSGATDERQQAVTGMCTNGHAPYRSQNGTGVKGNWWRRRAARVLLWALRRVTRVYESRP